MFSSTEPQLIFLEVKMSKLQTIFANNYGKLVLLHSLGISVMKFFLTYLLERGIYVEKGYVNLKI